MHGTIMRRCWTSRRRRRRRHSNDYSRQYYHNQDAVGKHHHYRYSIQSLLDLAAAATSSPQQHQEGLVSTGRTLLAQVATRLQRQQGRLQTIKDVVIAKTTTATTTTTTKDDNDDDKQVFKAPQSSLESENNNNNNNIIRTSSFHTPFWKQSKNHHHQQQQQQQQQAQQQVRQQVNTALKSLDTLTWIHTDTHESCQSILNIDATHPSMPRYLRETLTQIQARHARSVETLAEMVIQLKMPPARLDLNDIVLDNQWRKDKEDFNKENNNNIPSSLDVAVNSQQQQPQSASILVPFLQERLGIQLLCEHYMELCKTGTTTKKQKPHGTLDVQRSMTDTILDATGEAKMLCEAYYNDVPSYKIVHDNDKDGHNHDNETITATFVGPWLHYVLVEVLKNATTATVEKFVKDDPNNNTDDRNAPPNNLDDIDTDLPPIRIHVSQDETWTTIVVQDEGVGLEGDKDENNGDIDIDNLNHSSNTTTTAISQFRFGNTDKVWDRLEEQTTYAMVRSPLQGLGVGLALSACMMEHFGGQLRLESSDQSSQSRKSQTSSGGGTRAILQLPRDLTIPEKTFDDNDANGRG